MAKVVKKWEVSSIAYLRTICFQLSPIPLICVCLFCEPAVGQDYTLPLYSLSMDPEQLQLLLDNPWTPSRRPAVITHNGQDYPCHVRFRGATSRELPKKSWKIFYDDEGPQGEEETNLNAEYRDISYCRNALSMDISRKIGLPASQVRHLSLLVNGIYWGVYIEVEEVEEEFFESRGLTMHALFKSVAHGARFAPPLYSDRLGDYYEFEEVPSGAVDTLMKRMTLVQEGTQELFGTLSDSYFDRDNILKYFALQYALHNFDGSTKNIFYCEGDDGIYRHYPWDMDASLGNDWTGEFVGLATDPDPGPITFNALFQRLLALPGAENQFRDELHLIADSGFTYAAERAVEYYDLIRHDAFLDTAKRADNEVFEQGLTNLLAFITERRAFLLASPGLQRVDVREFRARDAYLSSASDPIRLSARIEEPVGSVYAIINNLSDQELWLDLDDNGYDGDSIAGDHWYSREFTIQDMAPPFYFCFRTATPGDQTVSFTPPAGNMGFFLVPLALPCIRVDSAPPSLNEIGIGDVSIFHTTPVFGIPLRNVTDRELNLSSCVLRIGNSYQIYRFSELDPLAPNAEIIVGNDPVMLDWLFPNSIRVVGMPFRPQDGDSIFLETSNGTRISSAVYESSPLDEPVGSVVVNEINFNSASVFDAGDWIELYAPNETVDLGGWILRDNDDGHVYEFSHGVFLNAGEYLIVAEDPEEFTNHYSGFSYVAGPIDFGFESNGDDVRLFDAFGKIVDWVSYSGSDPWPQGANGTGKTLELSNSNMPNYDHHEWSVSLDETPHGTPGTENLTAPPPPPPQPEPFVPEHWQIADIFPNPFNQQTRIQFHALSVGEVSISIYDVLGRQIKTLNSLVSEPGSYHVFWSGDTDSQSYATTGIYFVRMEVPVQTGVRKLVLLR